MIYIKERRSLCLIYTAQLLSFVAYMTGPVLLAPYAKLILHATASQFGQIEAACSVGLILSGLTLPWLAEKFGVTKITLLFSLLGAISFAFFSVDRSIEIAELLYFLIGFYYGIWALLVTRAQHLTAFDYQGRTQGSFFSLASAAILIVYLGVDLLNHLIGLHWLYVFEVIAALLIILVVAIE